MIVVDEQSASQGVNSFEDTYDKFSDSSLLEFKTDW